MIKWLHHLLNPHCIECRENDRCKQCEILERQLEVERARQDILLSRLTNGQVVNQVVESETEPSELKPLPMGRRRHIPYAVKQQMIEAEDEKGLKTLIDKYEEIRKLNMNASIDEIEKELMETNVLEPVANNG